MIRAPAHIIGDHNRKTEIIELLDRPLRDLVEEATTAGWSTKEVLDAVGELVRGYRAPYAEDVTLGNQKAKNGIDSENSGEFPSAECLVDAFVKGRDVS